MAQRRAMWIAKSEVARDNFWPRRHVTHVPSRDDSCFHLVHYGASRLEYFKIHLMFAETACKEAAGDRTWHCINFDFRKWHPSALYIRVWMTQ
jgi:hypothetical protein